MIHTKYSVQVTMAKKSEPFVRAVVSLTAANIVTNSWALHMI